MAEPVTVDATGMEALSLFDMLTEINRRLQAALGAELVTDPETPQGQLSGIWAFGTTELGEIVVASGEASSVLSAGGRYLDDQGSLLVIERKAATHSTVTATVDGVSGTDIPAGSRARTDDGDEFETLDDVILGTSGVSVDMRAVQTGPVEAAAATLTTIVTVVAGWETITNANAATIGRDIEGDTVYRDRLIIAPAKNAVGMVGAMIGAASDHTTGTPVLVENRTASERTERGWPLLPNSTCVIGEPTDASDLSDAVDLKRAVGSQTLGVIVGDAPVLATIRSTSSGTVTWRGTATTGLSFGNNATGTAIASALNAATFAGVAFAFDAVLGRFAALFGTKPAETSALFGTSALETALGLAGKTSPGVFAVPQEVAVDVVVSISTRIGWPSDGLMLARAALIATVAAIPLGDEVWNGDLQAAIEAIPGARVTSLTAEVDGGNVSVWK